MEAMWRHLIIQTSGHPIFIPSKSIREEKFFNE